MPRRDVELERALVADLRTSHPELRYFERVEVVRAQLEGRPANTDYLERTRQEIAGEFEAERTVGELSEDELQELAEDFGISVNQAEDLYEALGNDFANPSNTSWDYERVRDYLDDLAEALDIEVEELWELWRYIYYGEASD